MLLISITPRPSLPWKYRIIAAVDIEATNHEADYRGPLRDRRAFIITERDDPMPYTVHELLPSGACHHGDYCETLASALRLFYDRVAHANAD